MSKLWLRWLRMWDRRAAERNIADMEFRESNGEALPAREWREAYDWRRRANGEDS